MKYISKFDSFYLIYVKYKNKVTREEVESLEIAILNIERGSVDSYEFVRVETSRGRVDCRYYRAEGEDKGVIMVGGIGGDFDTPANDLYP